MNNNWKFISPEYAALINPVACAAFAMRCEGRADIKTRTTLATGNTLDETALANINVGTVQIDTQICDAVMFITPFIELWNAVSLAYGCRFVNSLLTVSIDGEKVVNESAVNNHLLCPACLIAVQPVGSGVTDLTVLLGCECELALLGMCEMFFMPNGTNITATLDAIPTGAGNIDVNFGMILSNYTTKVRQGCLMGVGALDASQNAVEVHYPCNSSIAAPPAPAGNGALALPSPTAGPSYGPANMG